MICMDLVPLLDSSPPSKYESKIADDDFKYSFGKKMINSDNLFIAVYPLGCDRG